MLLPAAFALGLATGLAALHQNLSEAAHRAFAVLWDPLFGPRFPLLDLNDDILSAIFAELCASPTFTDILGTESMGYTGRFTDDQTGLAALCLTNKRLYALARPYLLRALHLNLETIGLRSVPKLKALFEHPVARAYPRFLTVEAGLLTLRTVQAQSWQVLRLPHLAAVVRHGLDHLTGLESIAFFGVPAHEAMMDALNRVSRVRRPLRHLQLVAGVGESQRVQWNEAVRSALEVHAPTLVSLMLGGFPSYAPGPLTFETLSQMVHLRELELGQEMESELAALLPPSLRIVRLIHSRLSWLVHDFLPRLSAPLRSLELAFIRSPSNVEQQYPLTALSFDADELHWALDLDDETDHEALLVSLGGCRCRDLYVAPLGGTVNQSIRLLAILETRPRLLPLLRRVDVHPKSGGDASSDNWLLLAVVLWRSRGIQVTCKGQPINVGWSGP